MSSRKLCLLAVLTIAIVAFGTFTASAQQYQTQQTSQATISSDGKAEVTGAGGSTVEIYGASGANVTVSTTVYTEDPQPGATREGGTKLSSFFVIEFAIPEEDFENATLVIPFTDADLAGMAAPYVLLKYDPATNTYNELTGAVVDLAAHTITVVLTSTTDPLFALSGTDTSATPAPTENAIPLSTYALIIIAIGVITGVIVVLAVYQRKSASKKAA